MELGSALPADLLTACQPAGGPAPALQRRAAADPADESASPAGFDLLLQMLLGQPPGGEPLPAAGKDLPPSTTIPAAAPALTASLPTPAASLPTPAATPPEPAGTPPSSSTDPAAPSDDPAAALRAALVAVVAESSVATGSTPAPSTPAKPAGAEPLPPPPAAVRADLPAGDAPHAAAVLEAPPPSQPPTAPAAATVAPTADSPQTAVAVAAIVQSVATDGPHGVRPGVCATNSSAAQPWTSAPPTAAGVAAAVTPAGGDEAAALAPLAAAAPVQAAELRTVRHDDPIPLVLQAAAGADIGGAPLGHAAAHAAGASAPTPAAPNVAPPAQPALPQAPVDTAAARWHEALASRVHWLVDHGVGEARIRLNPPELGALDVKVSLQDDKTFVQVTAHTAAARDELTQSLPRLRELLSAGGLNLGGATVSGGRDDRAGRYAAAEPARAAGFAGGIEPAFAPRAASSARGLVDLFA
jgi:flagellar hook-length control protein FliK